MALLSLPAGASAELSFELLPAEARSASATTSATASASGPAPASTSVPAYPPFPPASWRASFLGADAETRGNWVGSFGGDGGVLFGAAEGGSADLSFLPPYIASVTPIFAVSRGLWAANVSDSRVPQDPHSPSGPRTAGYLASQMGGDPTFAIEVAVAPGSLAEGQQFSLALYAVDWDVRGRRGTVALLDGASLDPISPIQQLSSYEEGVWLKYNYTSSLRIRVSQSRGDNCVVSALVFGA